MTNTIDIWSFPKSGNLLSFYKYVLAENGALEYRDGVDDGIKLTDTFKNTFHYSGPCLYEYIPKRLNYLFNHKYSPILFSTVTRGNVQEKIIEFLNSISSGISFKTVTDVHTFKYPGAYSYFTGDFKVYQDEKKRKEIEEINKCSLNLVEILMNSEVVEAIPYAEYMSICALRIFHFLEKSGFYCLGRNGIEKNAFVFDKILLDDFWKFCDGILHGMFDSRRVGTENVGKIKERFNEIFNIRNYTNAINKLDTSSRQSMIVLSILGIENRSENSFF